MKVIIAGSRSVTNYKEVVIAVEKAKKQEKIVVTEVVSGAANGVDKLGEQYAKENNIPISYFPADWDLYGKKAGYLRNVQMAEYADALICIWDGISNGSKHMIDIANGRQLKVYVHVVKNNEIDEDLFKVD